MRTIYVGFSSPKSWKIGSASIKAWIKKPYSHVFVAWKSDYFSRVLVYHAAHGNVHFLSLDRLLQENVIVRLFKLEVSEEQYAKLVTKCIDLAGEQYGYSELLKIIVKDLCDSVGIQCKIIKNDRGYICSELLAELLLDLGAAFERPTFIIRPDHIEEALKEMKAQEIGDL